MDVRGSPSTNGTRPGFEFGVRGLTKQGATETSRLFVTSQQVVERFGLARLELSECFCSQSFQYIFRPSERQRPTVLRVNLLDKDSRQNVLLRRRELLGLCDGRHKRVCHLLHPKNETEQFYPSCSKVSRSPLTSNSKRSAGRETVRGLFLVCERHMARTPALRQALSNAWLKARGLVSGSPPA